MSQTEKNIQQEIRLELSKYGIIFRINVGKVKMADGRWFDTGLPKGFPDLMFLSNNGKTAFIECKNATYKPSKEQVNFIETVKKMGFNAGIARSVEDAMNIIRE